MAVNTLGENRDLGHTQVMVFNWMGFVAVTKINAFLTGLQKHCPILALQLPATLHRPPSSQGRGSGCSGLPTPKYNYRPGPVGGGLQV